MSDTETYKMYFRSCPNCKVDVVWDIPKGVLLEGYASECNYCGVPLIYRQRMLRYNR